MNNYIAFQQSLVLSHHRRTFFSTARSTRSPNVVTRISPRCSMRGYLEQLVSRKDLSSDQVSQAMNQILSGEANDPEIAAFLSLLSAKGETVSEVSTMVGCMRERMIPVQTNVPVMDIVGTGGNKHSIFNISTSASILAAAAGCKIAKHGSRSVTSKSGSADVLEALGVSLKLSPQQVTDCIDSTGLAFMFAPNHHPAMARVKPVRQAIKLKTVFNILGPLLNPAAAEYAIVGVYTPVLLDFMADVLLSVGCKKAIVVHTDGCDEFSSTGISQIVEIVDGQKKRGTFDAEKELGIMRVGVEDLQGGDAIENAQIIRDVLAGKKYGPIAEAIMLNASVACYIYGRTQSIKDGMELIKTVIANGDGTRKLEELATFTQSVQPNVAKV